MNDQSNTSNASPATLGQSLPDEVRMGIEKAIGYGVIDRRDVCDDFRRRARRAFRKNLREPGDCGNDRALLLGLAIAQAKVGMGPGWIPETQRIGCLIASKLT